MTVDALYPRPRLVGTTTTEPLPPQGYRVRIGDDGATTIDAADAAGRFYAEQAVAALGATAGIVIEDWPDIETRGVMLDVSRDKVPTMATLYALVDRLAALRINQLQLYMEHTFAYRGHDEVWSKASPFTADEIRDLDAYCAARFVELVPNQNCLGHMERWLRVDTYKPLAISPDGWTDARRRHRPPTTLDPAKPGSFELVRGLLAELLPNFESDRVHVGLDEPWELADERFGEYLAYIRDLRAAPELDGREMLIWGDIVARHPERAGDLPGGVTVCEWGYEADHPFDARAESLARAGLDFWLCPGTSSWNSIVGRWTNMRENCASAADAAVRHGARGYLVTDWGDNGHLQYLPFSEPGFAWAAGMAWCADANRDVDVEATVSHAVFGDATGNLGPALRMLGDVHRASTPQLANNSILAVPLLAPNVRVGDGYTEGMTDDELGEASSVIDAAIRRVDAARPTRADGDLVRAEIRAGAALMALLVDDLRARLRAGGTLDAVPAATRERLAAELVPIIDTHRTLWRARNREGGLADSCSRLERLRTAYAAAGG